MEHTFYEKNRDDGVLFINTAQDVSFPPHFHLSIEVVLLKKGAYTMTVNGKEYVLQGSSVAIADSFDVHAYKKIQSHTRADAYVLLIPYSYFARLDKWREGKQIECHVLQNEKLCNQLFDLVNAYLPPSNAQSEQVQRATIELILSILYEHLTFTPRKANSEVGLVREILVYLQENYRTKVTRASLARALGYTPEHLSRVFHRYVKKSFSQYVNGLRLEYVEEKRREGDTRTELALLYEAGFNSWQTYYRVKKGR